VLRATWLLRAIAAAQNLQSFDLVLVYLDTLHLLVQNFESVLTDSAARFKMLLKSNGKCHLLSP
jgi:hypothetical protein